MHDHSVFCTFAYPQGLVLPGAQALRARLRKEFRNVTYHRDLCLMIFAAGIRIYLSPLIMEKSC